MTAQTTLQNPPAPEFRPINSQRSKSLRIILNGVTGRMGTNQHFIRSILAIRRQGGVKSASGEVILPEPILVGRNEEKLRALAAMGEGIRFTTDLDAALAEPGEAIYFDAQVTSRRVEAVRMAIAAGKHVYCEKPTATTTREACSLYELAKRAGIKHGVVQDKLWLPGIRKLHALIEAGFFGEILSVRGEFGYWVFSGEETALQRPSWNYRREEGGGIIVDMLPHWRYLLDHLFGEVRAVNCIGATHLRKRWDENRVPYTATADDAAYATFELASGVIAHINSSWVVRVRRDDLFTLQVDGTEGSAVAGLRDCLVQAARDTPRCTWNPDLDNSANHFNAWTRNSEPAESENAFKAQWELFLRHVAFDEPFPWDLREGAKGVQLAELGLQSWSRRAWVDVPELPSEDSDGHLGDTRVRQTAPDIQAMNNPESSSRDKDTNRDPITGEPGSHPVGTGLGAAGGGTTGAAIGMAAGGPVGAVVGAAIGAVAGGLAGKGVAEAVDPTAEDAHWRGAHSRESYYDNSLTYDDYAPAYRTGYSNFGEHRAAGRNFDTAEPHLQQAYEKAKGNSKLGWEKAKHATRAAWDRVERAIPGDSDRDGK